MPAQFTTTLPDEDQPALGNGVEDEIAVDRESATTNYGDVRIQTRETGASAWDSSATGWDEQVFAYSTLTTNILGREDGEEYEVRARTETEHVTGAWTSPVEIVTKFPGATNLTVDSVTSTSVGLSWSDNSDNEDGSIVERREQFPDGWGAWLERSDEPANTTSFSDDVLPDTTYEFRIRAYTEHTAATSDSVETTTTDDGVRSDRVPPQGPHVVIETDDGRGTTRMPTLIDVEWSPEINSRPSVDVTVPHSDRWDGLEGSSMRVYRDGVQLPIDTLEAVAHERGSGGARTILTGSGGAQLDQYTDDIQIDEQETHLAARDLINEYTDYARNVDDPATDTRADVLMLTESGASIEDALVTQPAATDPWEVTQVDGAVQLQTGWFREVENEDYTGGVFFADTEGNDGAWSNNRAVRFQSSGDGVQFTVVTDHEIPEGDLKVEFLRASPDGNPPFDVLFNGNVVDAAPTDALTNATDEFDLSWGISWTLNPNGAVEPGIHQVELACTGSGSGDFYADAVHVRDDRESFTFDADPVDGVVDGPERYPQTSDVVLEDVVSVEQVIGGDFAVSMSSTAGAQAVAISNDEGQTWIEDGNSETVSGDFASASQQIRARVTLSGYSSDSTTSPAQGDTGQSVDELELRADLEDTPVLLDKSYRDRLDNVLASIADDGRMVWELRRDPNAAEDDLTGYIIEWTQIGQRTRASDQPVASLETRVSLESAFERVVVFGRSKRREGIEWEQPSNSNLTGLGDSWIVPDSERIYDLGTGEVFERGDDYRMEWDVGGLEILDGGSMSTDTTYGADYEFRYRGEATTPGVAASEARTVERQIPGATSNRECDQLALSVLKDVQDARLEATVTLLEERPDVPLVEALSHPELPDGAHEVRGVETGPGGDRQYRLANREALGEIFDELKRDVSALADVV